MRIYTVEDLMPMLRVSRKAIRSYVAEGKLIGRKVGKRYLVAEDAVKAFLLHDERPPKSLSSVAERLAPPVEKAFPRPRFSIQTLDSGQIPAVDGDPETTERG